MSIAFVGSTKQNCGIGGSATYFYFAIVIILQVCLVSSSVYALVFCIGLEPLDSRNVWYVANLCWWVPEAKHNANNVELNFFLFFC